MIIILASVENGSGAPCAARVSLSRPGAMAVEAAVVYPVMLVLFLGLIVGGMGVFRYQQVACQAREAARWASVRGVNWQLQTNQDSPTKQQIYQQAVLPYAAGMDTSMLSIQVLWINQATGTAVDWDSAGKDVQSLPASQQPVTNTIRVTITYQWSPNLFLVGPVNLTSTSEIPMSN
jgi:Flp pilus assembly protein TadG